MGLYRPCSSGGGGGSIPVNPLAPPDWMESNSPFRPVELELKLEFISVLLLFVDDEELSSESLG